MMYDDLINIFINKEIKMLSIAVPEDNQGKKRPCDNHRAPVHTQESLNSMQHLSGVAYK